MSRFLFWILLILIAPVVVAFTMSNSGPVNIDLWPISFSFELPVFAVVLAAIFIGFVCGGIVSFVSAGRRRARNRQLMRMLENSKREEALLREQIKKLETAAAGKAPPQTTDPARPALLTKVDAA